jgi:hypothetical protein
MNASYRVDALRGQTNGRVSSQWWNRPDDERFTSLRDLLAATQLSADTSRADVIEAKAIKVIADREDADKLSLELPNDSVAQPTHWSFGQLCSLVQAPAAYLRKLPAALAGINLQYGLNNHRGELVKTYTRIDGSSELRAVTGPDYGRITDAEVVQAVMRIAGDGTGDTHWKVPGVLEGLNRYNPFVDVTKHNTTLFASDRDVFIFLVDDLNPIEIGKLPDGSPDLVFRGFYVWNSEVGSRTCGIATMYLRGVCQNRILWGVEGFKEMSIRHTKNGPSRFLMEAKPALESFANASTGRLIEGVNNAKSLVVAHDEDERRDFLTGRGFTAGQAEKVIEAVVREEGKEPESIWDFVQGITAVARDIGHQDARIDLEKKAGGLLSRVK